jgi:hypothetical protein
VLQFNDLVKFCCLHVRPHVYNSKSRFCHRSILIVVLLLYICFDLSLHSVKVTVCLLSASFGYSCLDIILLL